MTWTLVHQYPKTSDFIVIGALEIATPSKYDLAPGHLRLLLDVLNDLQKTVQRNRDCKLIRYNELISGNTTNT